LEFGHSIVVKKNLHGQHTFVLVAFCLLMVMLQYQSITAAEQEQHPLTSEVWILNLFVWRCEIFPLHTFFF
jgi:hypothetical protein